MSAFEVKTELPEVETFNPLGNTLVHTKQTAENAVISPQIKTGKELGPLIAKGGYTLTVPGAEGMSAPFIEQDVSTKGRFNSGPLVNIVEDKPHSLLKKETFFSKTAAVILAANICLLASVFYFSGFLGDEFSAPITSEERLAAKRDSAILTGSIHKQTEATASLIDNYKTNRTLSGEGALQPRQVKTLRVRLGGDNKITISPNVSLKKKIIIPPKARPERLPKKVSAYQPSGSFVKELKALEAGTRTKPITIVHIGDSHIAGDGLSEGIRKGLQDRFGDAGRGAIVPANAYAYTRAAGLRLTTSGPWDTAIV